jgi:hypothetical protein
MQVNRRRHEIRFIHIRIHLLSSFDRAGLTWRATRAASVKASFTPRLRIAEHSANVSRCLLEETGKCIPRYRRAPILLATSRPSLYCIIPGPGCGSSSSFSCSSLRSHLRAHSTTFTPGQCSDISATHFVDTFSRDPWLSTCHSRQPLFKHWKS